MNQKKPIYLDYMSTTPVDPQVVEKMRACLGIEGCFGNAASMQHCYGVEAHEQIEQARLEVALLINANAAEIIWTSGCTESNNLALKGAAQFYARQGRHIITMATEHKAVLEPCKYLAAQGFEITYLMPQQNGLLNLDTLASALRPDTILASIMHVNSETGVIQPIEKIGALLKQRGIIFHVDAAQSAGKIAIDVKKMNIDLLSLSAHKFYGPKGIGALYLRQSHPRVRLMTQLHGSGHEHQLRSGTLPTHQIVGMGAACNIARQQMKNDEHHASTLADYFWQGLQKMPGVQLNGDPNIKVANCLNIYFADIEGESLLTSLNHLALSARSACNSVTLEPSHVLMAMGLPRIVAQNAVRFSFGRYTTLTEIKAALEHIQQQVQRLRRISPVHRE